MSTAPNSRANRDAADDLAEDSEMAYRTLERDLRERDDAMWHALVHYAIGAAVAARGLPVDWEYVALRMAQALEGRDREAAPEAVAVG